MNNKPKSYTIRLELTNGFHVSTKSHNIALAISYIYGVLNLKNQDVQSSNIIGLANYQLAHK